MRIILNVWKRWSDKPGRHNDFTMSSPLSYYQRPKSTGAIMHFRERNQGVQQATRNTQDCEAICVETIQHCLDVGGSHTEPSHVRLLQDCADICDTSTKFLLRNSPQHEQLLAACANLCDLCAAS